MFCPKCGTQNPENGKFCRSCGTDIAVVTNALAGKNTGVNKFDFALAELEKKDKRRKNPDDVFADGIREIFGGLGFVAVAVILAVTGIIGGKVWWFWLLIPATAMMGNGIANIWKSKRMAKRIKADDVEPNLLNQPQPNAVLPPINSEYIAPETRYKTGDLVPPSVTDSTTRHLEINTENETMTLPKK